MECNHSEQEYKPSTLEFIEQLPGEVYICQACGGLFDYRAEKNDTGTCFPMTKDEIITMIDLIILPYKEAVEKMRDIVNGIDEMPYHF